MSYLYKHVRKDTNDVFYVGIGLTKDLKYKRAYNRHKRNKIWKSITAKTDYYVHIFMDDISEEEAKEMELEFVYTYGRINLGTGTLANLTQGGDGTLGYVHSEEYKRAASERMKGENNPNFGKTPSQEAIQKGIESRAGYKHSEETKEKISKMLLGHKNPNYGKGKSKKTIEKWRESHAWYRHSDETKRKMSGEFCYYSKLVLNLETGIFYVSSRDAFRDLSLKMSERHFCAMLSGRYPNKTSCVRV